MIREIINFTNFVENNIENDLFDFIEPPQQGLYIIVKEDGSYKHEFYDKGDNVSAFLKDCIMKIQYSWTIEYDKKPYYQKCYDLPKKRIHSVSPFLVALKRKYLVGGSDYKSKKVDFEYIEKYLKKATDETTNESTKQFADLFKRILKDIFPKLIQLITKTIFKKENYVLIFYNASIDAYKSSYYNYLKLKIFNSSKLGLTDINGNSIGEEEAMNLNDIRGWSNFYNGYNAEKLFLRHISATFLTNRISNTDARLLFKFKDYRRLGLLPNPLPIFIDYDELNQKNNQSEIIRIFNNQKRIKYREIIRKIFEDRPRLTLQKFYLLNINKGEIVDFDFVPKFRYEFDTTILVENVTKKEIKKSGTFEIDKDKRISNVFDFERIVVSSIFNNSLVKIKEDKYNTAYFDDIDPKYVSGDSSMWQLIMKYRKAFYDYIYKSKTNAITTSMFDDMMLNSIISNIQNDEIKTRCEYNNSIKTKINIWFSVYNLFNNNKKECIMASNVTELLSKMKFVANGESNIETPKEFAFGAGQLASYLIDRSVASNKTYAMLEPYLQKNSSGLLQDALAQTIVMYKHDIGVYKGKFEKLSTQVLTYDSNISMKPLLKYFLAGCFCKCIIYEKKEEIDNNK